MPPFKPRPFGWRCLLRRNGCAAGVGEAGAERAACGVGPCCRAKAYEQLGQLKQALADLQRANRLDAATPDTRESERRLKDLVGGKKPAGLGNGMAGMGAGAGAKKAAAVPSKAQSSGRQVRCAGSRLLAVGGGGQRQAAAEEFTGWVFWRVGLVLGARWVMVDVGDANHGVGCTPPCACGRRRGREGCLMPGCSAGVTIGRWLQGWCCWWVSALVDLG